MPTYDFRCPVGHDFERFFPRISEAASEVPCPECGAVATRRISGGAGLLFKGSGFYITDYGKDGKKDLRERQQSSGNGKGGKGDGGKSEGSGGSGGTGSAGGSASGGSGKSTASSGSSGSSGGAGA